jgi:NADPH2:quinone reductase
MRAVRVRKYGPPEVLVAEELPDPRPDAGQVIVEVATIGVNFMDTRLRAGTFAGSGGPTPPFVPGNEVGGVVVEVGPGVDPTLEGKRVVTGTGGRAAYAERVAVAAEGLVEIPKELEIKMAVALFAQGRTAVGLVRETRPAPREHVLVEAAAGGVGSLLVQLAKEAGATVLAAARGEYKLKVARRLGADVTVDYAQPDWAEQLRHKIGDAGLEVVFDSVGGDIGRTAFDLLAGGGRFAIFGFASGAPTEASTVEILRSGVTVIGFGGPRLLQRPEYARELEYEALREAAAGRLMPVIGQRFPLERAAEAHAAIEDGATVSKTLLVP